MEEHVQLVEWLSLAMEPSEALDMLACMAAHREGEGEGAHLQQRLALVILMGLSNYINIRST